MVHAHMRGMRVACEWDVRGGMSKAWAWHGRSLCIWTRRASSPNRKSQTALVAKRPMTGRRTAASSAHARLLGSAWHVQRDWRGMPAWAGCLTSHVHGMHLARAWHAVWTRSMACACVRYLADAEDALEDVDQAPDCEGVPSR